MKYTLLAICLALGGCAAHSNLGASLPSSVSLPSVSVDVGATSPVAGAGVSASVGPDGVKASVNAGK
jgi:hypothetical protein